MRRLIQLQDNFVVDGAYRNASVDLATPLTPASVHGQAYYNTTFASNSWWWVVAVGLVGPVGLSPAGLVGPVGWLGLLGLWGSPLLGLLGLWGSPLLGLLGLWGSPLLCFCVCS